MLTKSVRRDKIICNEFLKGETLMLKNIIFDYGNTIIRYEPYEIVESFGVTDQKDKCQLVQVCFDRKYWDKLDDGTLSQADFVKQVKTELPHCLHKIAEEICNDWYKVTPVIEGVEVLINKLKRQGYKLYLLSNIGEMFCLDRSKIKLYNEYFDAGVLSSEEKLIKPDVKIFECLLDRYGLKAEECFFVDDLQANIDGAARCAIRGFKFEANVNELEKAIYNMRQAAY